MFHTLLINTIIIVIIQKQTAVKKVELVFFYDVSELANSWLNVFKILI